jgi:uncharacterized OB-fold protein
MSRHLGETWTVPALDSHNRAWFTAGQIVVQACRACGRDQHPPEEVCGGCQSFDLEDRPRPGTGRIESCVIVHHPVHPGLAERVPYAVVLVSIDGASDANAIGNVVNRAYDEVSIGQRVRAVFEDATDPVSGEALKIPQWEIVDA